MSIKVLKQYITESIKEGWGFRSLPDEEEIASHKKKEKGFFEKLKNFFTGNEFGDVIDDWITDQEYYHDIVVPDAIKDDAEEFLKAKGKKIAARARGDEARASSLIRKLLNTRYGRTLKDMAREQDESF